MKSLALPVLSFSLLAYCAGAYAADPKRDEFFWLGEMNKATLVINTEEGLIEKSAAPIFAEGIEKVLAAGDQKGAKRPSTVITFEPLMIEAAGPEITLLHAGRSSQDMHATYRAAILRLPTPQACGVMPSAYAKRMHA